jgi:hypothetical protein
MTARSAPIADPRQRAGWFFDPWQSADVAGQNRRPAQTGHANLGQGLARVESSLRTDSEIEDPRFLDGTLADAEIGGRRGHALEKLPGALVQFIFHREWTGPAVLERPALM